MARGLGIRGVAIGQAVGTWPEGSVLSCICELPVAPQALGACPLRTVTPPCAPSLVLRGCHLPSLLLAMDRT